MVHFSTEIKSIKDAQTVLNMKKKSTCVLKHFFVLSDQI